MQSIAEEGIAAHWKYKERDGGSPTPMKMKHSWLKRLVEWQQEVRTLREFPIPQA
jgi:GTP pyrophosphokinase